MTPDIEKAAADAGGDAVKKGVQVAMVVGLVIVVVVVFWPQLQRVFAAVDAVQQIPALETRVGKIETELRDTAHERKDMRRDIKDLSQSIANLQQTLKEFATRTEALFDRHMPRSAAPPAGWSTTTVPSKPGT